MVGGLELVKVLGVAVLVYSLVARRYRVAPIPSDGRRRRPMSGSPQAVLAPSCSEDYLASDAPPSRFRALLSWSFGSAGHGGYGSSAVLALSFRASMALTVSASAFSRRLLPMVPSTKPSTRPLRFLPSRTTTASKSVVPLGCRVNVYVLPERLPTRWSRWSSW